MWQDSVTIVRGVQVPLLEAGLAAISLGCATFATGSLRVYLGDLWWSFFW